MAVAPTRGERNNNPGNIDYNVRNQWDGQLGLEDAAPGIKPRFAKFSDPVYGIRALAKLLLNYRGKDGMPGAGNTGIDTVKEVINRWAPSNENDTNAYVLAVAQRIGVNSTAVIDIKNPVILKGLVMGIIKHENGRINYTDAVIESGIAKALA